MQIVRPTRAWLLLGLCAAAIGCSGEPATQVVTGHVALDEGAVAVRAVSGTSVVTAAEVRTDGSFTLVLPAGESYRLEGLTRSGALKRLGPGAATRRRCATSHSACASRSRRTASAPSTSAAIRIRAAAIRRTIPTASATRPA